MPSGNEEADVREVVGWKETLAAEEEEVLDGFGVAEQAAAEKEDVAEWRSGLAEPSTAVIGSDAWTSYTGSLRYDVLRIPCCESSRCGSGTAVDGVGGIDVSESTGGGTSGSVGFATRRLR